MVAVRNVTSTGGLVATVASSTASIGATRHTRRAGSTAAVTVAATPMTTAHPSACHDTIDPATGMGLPSSASTHSMPRPISSPSGAPMSDATTASSAASTSAARSS